MPGKGSSCHGFQLWINLPIELKDIEPSYQKVEAERIQKKEEDKATIRTSIGDNSPTTVEVLYQDFQLKENGFIEIDLPKDPNDFIYIYEGKITLDGLEDIDKSTAFFPKDEKKYL
jgi:redox-sensitive bicupin YhaK (pirin superfamily)